MDNMIDLDVTVFIQLANFIITIIILNYLLIKPIREQIATRNALTSNYTTQAEQFTSEASQKLSGYESALAAARTDATAVREQLKTEAKTAEADLLAVAQADAHAFVQTARTRTAEEAKAAMDSLLAQVNVFANKAVTRILG